MNEARNNLNAWRRNMLWALGLLAVTGILMLSYGTAERSVLARVVPSYPPYTDEETAEMFASLYGYTDEITRYAAHPMTVAVNSTAEAMHDDVSNRVKGLLEDVYSTIKNLLILASGAFAILAVRPANSTRQRYAALALTILPGVLLVVLILGLVIQ